MNIGAHNKLIKQNKKKRRRRRRNKTNKQKKMDQISFGNGSRAYCEVH